MKRLALALALMLAAGPAAAGPLSDLIMASGLLADAPAGEVLRYAHDRRLPAEAPDAELPRAGQDYVLPKPVVDGVAILPAVPGEGGTQLVLTLAEAGESRDVASFPAQGANPMLLFFLENVVRNVAAQTGGSPFYIRNRLRDALVAADLGPVQDGRAVIALHPFAADPNRARLGAFAELTLTLALDPARPGRLLDLKADTGAAPGGYSEHMVLIGVE